METRLNLLTMIMALLAMVLCITPITLYAQDGHPPPPFPPFLWQLDQNGDNRISFDEFSVKIQLFNHFDRNGDGFIDADDAPKRPKHTEHLMDRMDKNGDGQISLDEFPGPETHFRILDKDGDALLTQEELEALPPPGPPPPIGPGPGFEANDEDQFGMVSKIQSSATADHFTPSG